MHIVVVRNAWRAMQEENQLDESTYGSADEGGSRLREMSGQRLSLLVALDVALLALGLVGMVVGVQSALS